jgi:hypothetical protein
MESSSKKPPVKRARRGEEEKTKIIEPAPPAVKPPEPRKAGNYYFDFDDYQCHAGVDCWYWGCHLKVPIGEFKAAQYFPCINVEWGRGRVEFYTEDNKTYVSQVFVDFAPPRLLDGE